MDGWEEVPEEEGTWITIYTYKDENEGHLDLLPGDEVVPIKQTEVNL